MVFQPLPKHFTTPWFFRGTFLFHCHHSETWSGTSPQATRVNRVWLTVPSHRPDHLGYMLMCSPGRERSEIQGLCGRRPNRPCTGKAQTDIWLSSISGKKPCITQRDGMHQKELVTQQNVDLAPQKVQILKRFKSAEESRYVTVLLTESVQ